MDVTDTTYFGADRQHFTDAGQATRALDNKPIFLAAQAGQTLAPLSDHVRLQRRVFRASNGFSWTDQSSNGDVVSTTSTTGATLLTNAINGQPAVRLAAVPLTGLVPGGLSGAAPFQFLAVVRLTNSSDNLNLLGYGGDPGQGGAIADMIVFNGQLCLHTMNASQGDGVNTFTAPHGGQFAIVGVRWDGTNGYSYTNTSGPSQSQPIYRTTNQTPRCA